MAPLLRSSTGTIAPITGWLHCGDHKVAPLRRSRNGTIALPINICYRLCVNEKMTLADISAYLKERGVKSREGKRWANDILIQILKRKAKISWSPEKKNAKAFESERIYLTRRCGTGY